MIDTLEEALKKRKAQGLLRTLRETDGLIDLTSNDYFGFARSDDLLKKIAEIKKIGATGSRLLTGNHYYEELEKKIAAFHHAESCTIFNSGYAANVGLISSLSASKATFLYDSEIHASLIDGMRLARSIMLPFRHNDLNSLERKLKLTQSPVCIIVESIYSISGEIAPLKEITELSTKYGATLIVDEAHATGVFGLKGEGILAKDHLENLVFARIHTFSKALGSHGACVLGSKTLKSHLINFAHSLIYTTALPSICLFLIDAAYEKLEKEAEFHQQRLQSLIKYFQKKSDSFSQTPIQPIRVDNMEKLRLLSEKLHQNGVDVRPIFSPTIKKGKECLRVVLHSFNQEKEIDKLFEILT